MIAALANIPWYVHAMVQAVIGIYFFGGLFQRHVFGTKIFFAFGSLAMAAFVYHDLFGYPPVP